MESETAGGKTASAGRRIDWQYAVIIVGLIILAAALIYDYAPADRGPWTVEVINRGEDHADIARLEPLHPDNAADARRQAENYANRLRRHVSEADYARARAQLEGWNLDVKASGVCRATWKATIGAALTVRVTYAERPLCAE